MKKLMIILMPITIIIAIICIINEKETSYMELIEGVSRLEFKPFPMATIEKAMNEINFKEVWEGIWDNINNPLDWFGAIGNSFKAIWESIVQIGKMLWGVIQFGFDFITWFFSNIFTILKFIFDYLGFNIQRVIPE